jgi:peptidoglycan/LPS O-acetylase OafA/YrhL
VRGIAALVVVLHHVYQVARPYIEPKIDAWHPGSVWWLISSTPLKLLTAGTESVIVFFVLSGFVVSLPLLRGGARAWPGFLVARMLRLYIPIWASVALSGIAIALVPHDPSQVVAGSWTERTNASAAPLPLLFSEASLIRLSFSTNSVLWSLRWEVIFSLALPLFVLLALALRRYWIVALCASFALTVLAKVVHIDAFQYLPPFLVGALIAVNLERLREWGFAVAARGRARQWGWMLLAASLLAMVTSWMARPIVHAGTVLSDAIGSLTILGAAGIVVAAITFEPVAAPLVRRIPQALGRISFSLYLVHLPIIVSLAFLFGDANWALVGVVGVPMSLAVAWMFSRLVEHPSHRLAKLVERRVGSIVNRIYIVRRAARAA